MKTIRANYFALNTRPTRSTASHNDTPITAIALPACVRPDVTATSRFATPSTSASKAQTALFALPDSGGARQPARLSRMPVMFLRQW